MKILVTLSYYTPNISGLTLHAKILAEELAKRGHEVTVLTSQHDKNILQREILNGVSVIRVPYLFKVGKGLFMPFYFLYAFRAVSPAEAILIHLPQFEGIIVAFLGRLLRKRIVSAYLCEVKLSDTPVHFIIELLLHFSNFCSMLLSNKVTTMTKDFAKHSKLLPCFSRKLSCIYPPIPYPVMDKGLQANVKNKLGIRKFYIGIASRIAREKGVEYLLDAIPLLKERLEGNFLIAIAGPKNPIGEETYRKKISPLLTKYKDYIAFLGILPSLGGFYSLLDLLVLPSVNSTEAFGISQVEAMFSGIPVVASNLPGVRVPIITTGMGELAEPKNSQDLAEKIVKILKDKRKYIKKREFIESKFSFKRTISEYERLFT